MIAIEPARLTDIKETFYLLIHATNRLHPAVLIDGSGDSQRLLQRHVRNRREQRVELGGGSAVPFNAAVGLLKNKTRTQRELAIRRITRAEKGAQDKHTFGMDGAAKFNFSLDVQNLTLPYPHTSGDTAWSPEGKFTKLVNREAVQLAYLRPFGVD